MAHNQVPPAYATGGGGTRLEHRYGATLLAHLLSEDPHPELGDDVAIGTVHFQAVQQSAVDDFLVEDDSGERVAVIAARRAPRFASSSPETIRLFAAFLTELRDHSEAIAVGSRRLHLITAAPSPALKLLDRLLLLARSTSESTFRAAAATPGRLPVRGQRFLASLDRVIKVAAEQMDEVPVRQDWTWALLSVLRHRSVRLEEEDLSDRTAAVTSLRHVLDPVPGAADRLFSRLDELAGQYASRAAAVTAGQLRRDCLNHPLQRAPRYRQAWRRFDDLRALLVERTPGTLPTESGEHAVPRATELQHLIMQLRDVADSAGALLIHGEPDVGKSALALLAAQHLNDDRCRVWAVSLRDLPDHPTELTDRLGVDLHDLLDSEQPSVARLLLLDAGETVLEGKTDTIRHLARTLPSAGIGIAVVSRDDAAGPLSSLLGTSSRPAGRHPVTPLQDDSLADLVSVLPHLQDLNADSRGSWLLRRPGLVEMLLHAPVELRAEQTLTEGDLYLAVWHHLVRRGEGTEPGSGTPDDREATLLRLAREAVTGHASTELQFNAAALVGLRSDGLLRSRGASSAAAPGEEFRNDLMRDFSVARYLLTGGLAAETSALPRWTVRAARIAAQARLRTAPSAATLGQLLLDHARLVNGGGARWEEIPLEALLALADEALLADADELLHADDSAGLRTLQRLALQRHRTGTAGDPRVFTALNRYLMSIPARVPSRRREDRTQYQEVVLSWLRGLLNRDELQPQRQQWRDALLATDPETWDEWAIEAIATLGPDLTTSAVAYLRRVASDRPYHLSAAVESPWAQQALLRGHEPLLLELTEQYYIDLDRHDLAQMDLGVRGHRNTAFLPMSAWHYGPFWALLASNPVEAIAAINRILNHATGQVRSTRWDGGDIEEPEHLEIRLHDRPLTLRDRDNSWGWYRGGGQGPPACVSALLAVERFADQLLQQDSSVLPVLHRLLLTGCENFAMAGLVVGLLVRHLDHADRMLDPWVQEPAIWVREFARATHERLRGDFSPGPRSFTFNEVAGTLVLVALRSADTARQDELRRLGEALLATATAAGGYSNSAGWAAVLDSRNYREITVNGRPGVEFVLPADVATANADTTAYLQRQQEALRLQSTYLYNPDDTADLKGMLSDIDAAQHLQQSSEDDSFAEAVAAVAAATIRHAALHAQPVPAAALNWAEETVLRLLVEAEPDLAETVWPHGADRSAARALPLLLLLGRDRASGSPVAATLRYANTHANDEIRLVTALGARPVWEAPCTSTDRPCLRHRPLLQALIAATGQEDELEVEPQLRDTAPLPAAYLVPLLLQTAAARAADCIGDQASAGFPHLLRLHRQALAKGTEHGYRPTRQPLAELLAREACSGRPGPMTEHAASLVDHPRTLTELLTDLGEVATYDQQTRNKLPEIWPPLMEQLVKLLSARSKKPGRDRDGWDVAALLPVPRIRPADDRFAQTYTQALSSGIPLPVLAPLMSNWIELAHGQARAIDDLVLLLRCDDRSAMHPLGLTWLDAAIGDDFHGAIRAGRIAEWLSHIRSSVLHDPSAFRRWHRIVDGLAIAGDSDAARLQQQDEH